MMMNALHTQGFPDAEGPEEMKRLAGKAVFEHHNQVSINSAATCSTSINCSCSVAVSSS
jgi:hypothetical protein